MSMSTRIKEERLKHGLTQDQLAALLGVQKSAIAKYENGRVENIKRSTIQKMAYIFGNELFLKTSLSILRYFMAFVECYKHLTTSYII